MSASRIHHINFVVRDLARAAEQFQLVLGLDPFEFIDHAPRGAKVARSRIGDTWFVLVCPFDPESVPGRFLAANGEGFFLLSTATSDLQAQLNRLASDGLTPIDRQPRIGILDWRVADIAKVHGVMLQFTDDSDSGS